MCDAVKPIEAGHKVIEPFIKFYIKSIISYIGDDPTREGLIETPNRVLRSWKELFSGYGKDPKEIFKTFDAAGCDQLVLMKDIPFQSTCVVGSTFVETPIGRIPIKYLKDGDWIYTIDQETKELGIVKCKNPRCTKKNAKLVRVYSDNDTVLCTPNHRFLTFNNGWVEAKDLQSGESIVSLYKTINKGEKNSKVYPYLVTTKDVRKINKSNDTKIGGKQKLISEHKFIYNISNNIPIFNSLRYYCIHHIDENRWNNLPENLEYLSIIEHNKKHNRFNGETNKKDSPHYEKRKRLCAESSSKSEVRKKRSKSVKAYWDDLKKDKSEYKKRCILTKKGIIANRNHRVIGVENVFWREDVYCMDVPETNTFFANGMAVHNCEHHMLIFWGVAHIAYIPNKRVIGASKLSRLLEIYSRRLQIQERIGEQITNDLMNYLKPIGAACILKCEHLCMVARGIKKQGSKMITSSLKGEFLNDASARNELLQMINKD